MAVEIFTICEHLTEKHGGQTGLGKAIVKTARGFAGEGDKASCLSSKCGHTCKTVIVDVPALPGDYTRIHPIDPVESEPTKLLSSH